MGYVQLIKRCLRLLHASDLHNLDMLVFIWEPTPAKDLMCVQRVVKLLLDQIRLPYIRESIQEKNHILAPYAVNHLAVTRLSLFTPGPTLVINRTFAQFATKASHRLGIYLVTWEHILEKSHMAVPCAIKGKYIICLYNMYTLFPK